MPAGFQSTREGWTLFGTTGFLKIFYSILKRGNFFLSTPGMGGGGVERGGGLYTRFDRTETGE